MIHPIRVDDSNTCPSRIIYPCEDGEDYSEIRFSGGEFVERYAYSPYGEVTVLDTDYSDDADGISDIGNEYFYTGRRLDPETKLQLNRNRFYHAPMGRWVNRDPDRKRGQVQIKHS